MRPLTVCKHKVSGSLSLPSRGPFHLSFTVLYAIGHWVVFRVGGWSPRLPTRFLVSRGTLDPARCFKISSTGLSPSTAGFPKTIRLSLSNANCSPQPRRTRSFGLASFPFARRYLGNRVFFLLLLLLRCFSSQRSLPYAMDSRMDT